MKGKPPRWFALSFYCMGLIHRHIRLIRPDLRMCLNIDKSQIASTKSQMVRQAVRQAHGPEQSRRTHHSEPGRRVNLKFQ